MKTTQEILDKLEELRKQYKARPDFRKIIVLQAKLLNVALKKRGAYQAKLLS